MDNEARVQEILKRRGLDVTPVDNFTEADVPEPTERFTKLINIYYAMKNTVDMEIPYWYNRVWWENEGDVIEIRRAKAYGAALSHTTPTIWPGEKLVMNKTKNWRGAFPFPWVDASFFNAQAEALMNEADAPPLAAADAVSVVGAGGGNVTKNFGNVISIAQKFGMRKEEIPVLVKVSKYWTMPRWSASVTATPKLSRVRQVERLSRQRTDHVRLLGHPPGPRGHQLLHASGIWL